MAAYEPSSPPAPVYTSFPVYVATAHQFTRAPEIQHIRDWLIWSIINLFIGLGAGIIPLIFSIFCQMSKGKNHVQAAQIMGRLALIFNLIITIGGILTWITLIVLPFVVVK
jgi:uncharacterized membrane protein